MREKGIAVRKKLKWIVPSAVLVVLIVSMVSLAATGALFSDTNAVGPNNILAGTLQLDVDDMAVSGIAFDFENKAPLWQGLHVWKVENVGSIDGYLDLENIVVTGTPSVLDGTADLAGLVGCRLFASDNNSVWFEAGDVNINNPNDRFSNLAASYNANIYMPAGATKYIVAQINWWDNGAADNAGQGDALHLNLNFELGQSQAQ